MSRSSSVSRLSRRWVAGLRWLTGLSLLALLLAQATHRLNLPALDGLERYLYDQRLAWSAPPEADPRIVVLDIDDKALAAHGRWPWRRGLLAELLTRCFEQEGAVLLGMDLILAEPDASSGLPALERMARGSLSDNPAFLAELQALRPQLDDDGQLAQALARHPVVLGFYFSESQLNTRSAALPAPLFSTTTAEARGLLALPNWQGYGGNLARLQEAAGQAGFLNAIADSDGLTRSSLLLARQGEQVFASLPLRLAQIALNSPQLTPLFSATGALTGLQLNSPQGPRRVATDEQGRVLLPYRQRSADFIHYSAADLLADRLPADALRGRIVLLGSSAAGLLDQRATPLAPVYPGVAVHATVLSALLDGTLAHHPADGPLLASLQLLAIALILLLALLRLPLWAGTLLAALLLAALLGLNGLAWLRWREAWPLAGPLCLATGLFGLHLLLAHLGERGARRRLTQLFGQYVPAALVAEMSQRPEQYSMASRSAELTVMFADVRGFTGISERLPPQALAELMNEYFSEMARIIGEHRGTVDKYMGDAVMAFWGAPLDDPKHARHAVQAAQAMQRSLVALNQRFAARGWPDLRISIGLNTGHMVVGDMGSQQRRAYTVLGDAVNLAARLQALCAEREAGILIGEQTQAAIPGLRATPLGAQFLRGRAAPLHVFQIENVA
ncbi:adenylate/guanylate cyclase domain-containing protein [Paucibacter sp. AS339]|uniref:CHASE2 domain-containing protein n=1 Tax=Paucibacter hankyongi TaxID=3133434 RepID=UPI0030B58E3A